MTAVSPTVQRAFSFSPVVNTDAENIYALVVKGESCDIPSLTSSAEIRMLPFHSNEPTRINAVTRRLILSVSGRVILSGTIDTVTIASVEDVEIVLENAIVGLICLRNPTVRTTIDFSKAKLGKVIPKNRSFPFPSLHLVGDAIQTVQVHLRGTVDNLVLEGAVFVVSAQFPRYPKNIQLQKGASYIYEQLQ